MHVKKIGRTFLESAQSLVCCSFLLSLLETCSELSPHNPVEFASLLLRQDGHKAILCLAPDLPKSRALLSVSRIQILVQSRHLLLLLLEQALQFNFLCIGEIELFSDDLQDVSLSLNDDGLRGLSSRLIWI